MTGAETDKGRAVRLVAELYAGAAGHPITTVGLGDADNDPGLLFSVDRPILLPKGDGRWADIDAPGLRRITRPGPLGWHDAITEVLTAPLHQNE